MEESSTVDLVAKYPPGTYIWYHGQYFAHGVHVVPSKDMNSKNFYIQTTIPDKDDLMYIFRVDDEDIRPLTKAEKILYGK